MSTEKQTAEFPIPKTIPKEDREQFIEDLIALMRTNAEKGKGIPYGESGLVNRSKSFPAYVKDKNGVSAYENSPDFKAAGKRKGQTPDLTLSGDMLASIEVLRTTKNSVVIGFKDKEQNAKADGNCRGTYGQDSPNPKKARNFMGLTESDFKKLVRKYE